MLFVVLFATLASLGRTQSSWQPGRATWFDVMQDLSKHNCHLRWDQISTGYNVAAFSDHNPLFAGSCGLCIEVKCENARFSDAYGEQLDRSGACKNSNVVRLTIADACPCSYPSNAYSNRRWCCGDDSVRQHLDLDKGAFGQLADVGLGVIGIQWRVVECGSPSSAGSQGPAPTQQTAAPSTATTAPFGTAPFTSVNDALETASASFKAAWQTAVAGFQNMLQQ